MSSNMPSMEETFGASGLDMGTSPLNWDPNGNEITMFDNGADGNETFFDASQYVNMDAFQDSPAPGYQQISDMSTDFKFSSGISPAPQAHMLQPRAAVSTSSPESSSHDSSSDSSTGNKKRKTSSESSPAGMSDAMWVRNTQSVLKKEQSHADGKVGWRDSVMSHRSNLSTMDPDMETIQRSMAGPFPHFSSNASSPGFLGNGINDQANYIGMSQAGTHPLVDSVSSVGTVRPAATFSLGSREQSPSTAGIMQSSANSPTALFNFATDMNDPMFQQQPAWNSAPTNQPWQSNMAMSGMEVTPSPTAQASMMGLGNHSSRSPQYQLHIGPISEKSRVETQVNIALTLHPMPPNVTKLHLPKETISKPKLLAKEEERVMAPDTLELSAMVVCTSAMEKPELYQRALKRAAGLPLPTLKRETRVPSADDADDSDDPDKPSNGGPVRICENCISRERKRASRKKLKKAEDNTEWDKYERDRVIVFNTNEYKDWQQPQPPKDLPTDFQWPSNAMQVTAPMRIACYCRHQNEKIGFRVIFTVKDFMGRVVAQNMTTSISITDDHKTRDGPAQAGRVLPLQDPLPQPNYFPTAHPVDNNDMHTTLLQRNHYSTTDLAALQRNYNPQLFNPTGLSRGPNTTQPTPTTMTPHNRSRQASPTVQQGPNKKRKNSSIHRIPHGLTMTRADAPQPISLANVNVSSTGMRSASALSGHSTTFSPTTQSFVGIPDHSFSMSAGPTGSMLHTGPPTPSSNHGLITPTNRSESYDNFQTAFYSVPGSTHPSRAPSPIPSTRMPMAVLNQPQATMGALHLNHLAMAAEPHPPRGRPIIRKILPPDGPVGGGIEVTVLGMHFHRDMEVMFGDQPATTTTFWSENTLVCLLPPSTRGAGLVPVTFVHERGAPPTPNAQLFKYVDNERQQLFELAIRALHQKGLGNGNEDYIKFAQQVVEQTGSPWAAGSAAQAHPGMQYRQASGHAAINGGSRGTEELLLKFLDMIDFHESPEEPNFDMMNQTGATFLSLASSLGYERFIAGLLARGANPNTRDVGGFTPLMKAAMRGHMQIVRRLVAKGADTSIRTIRGRKAVEFALSQELINFLRQCAHNRRPRSSHGTPHHSRANSMIGTRPYMGPPSPSQISFAGTGYEGEAEQSDTDASSDMDGWTISRRGSLTWNPSRRSSRSVLKELKELKDLTSLTAPTPPAAGWNPPFTPAAMTAWREQLAAHFQQLQQNYQWSLPNTFQFPTLPPMPQIPDYQAYPLVRRISSLLPPKSPPPPSEAPSSPPAYDEIYPEKQNVMPSSSKEKLGTLQAVAEAALDHVASHSFDAIQEEPSISSIVPTLKGKGKLVLKLDKEGLTRGQQELLRQVHKEKLRNLGSDRRLFFIWIPLLVLILALMLRSSFPAVASWTPLPAWTSWAPFATAH